MFFLIQENHYCLHTVMRFRLLRSVTLIIFFYIYFYTWNWIVKVSGLSDIASTNALNILGFPGKIMEPFKHTNSTLLSPEEQDIRWNDYVKFYQEYQRKLSQTEFERYVVYTTTYSGLANKLNGLISSLLIAMVTDRGFMCIFVFLTIHI